MNDRKRLIYKLILRDVRNLKRNCIQAVKSRFNSETLKPLSLKMKTITDVMNMLNKLYVPVKKYDHISFTGVSSDDKVKERVGLNGRA